MVTWRAWPLLLVLALVVAAVPAEAEHTPAHRHFVSGTVTNALGEPICGATVRAADITVQPTPADMDRTAVTDMGGRYSIQLHLHSQDAVNDGEATASNEGDTIRVTLLLTGTSRDVQAIPNAGNANGWGEQRIDFTVPADVKSPGLCAQQILLYGGIGVGALVLGVVGFRAVRRPRRGRGGRAHQLLAVPGVGRTRARELEAAGIKTVEDLASADPEDIARATRMTPKQARSVVKRAKDVLGADAD